jgi:hypothetical protein
MKGYSNLMDHGRQHSDSAGSVAGMVAADATTSTAAAYNDRFIRRDTDGRVLAYAAYALCRKTGRSKTLNRRERTYTLAFIGCCR